MSATFIPGRDVTSDLAQAVGLDPEAMPIRSIAIRSTMNDAVVVDVELYATDDQVGRVAEILRRYRLGSDSGTACPDDAQGPRNQVQDSCPMTDVSDPPTAGVACVGLAYDAA